MPDMTRRRFIESAGLAAATAPTLMASTGSAAQGQERAGSPRATARARDLTDEELEAMFHRCSNTGRWGPDDELGTLNYITPQKRHRGGGTSEDRRGRVGRSRSLDDAEQDQRAAACRT